jgi:hypothetical protein
MIVGLPSLWRLEYENATGETVTIQVQYRTQKLTSGALVYGSWVVATNDVTLATATSDNSDDDGYSNTGNLDLGAEVWWSITMPDSGVDADGLFTIRLQTGDSTSPTPLWQQEGDGIIVATAYVKTTTNDDVISGHFSI